MNFPFGNVTLKKPGRRLLHVSLWLFFISAAMVPGKGWSDMVVFDLLEDSSIYSLLDDKVTGSVTNGGIVATLTASEGVMNRTTDGFGVNGEGTDDTDALNLGQYIDIVFDQTVYFKNLNISSWGDLSSGEVRLGITDFTNQGDIQGTGDTTYDFKVDYGKTVRIFATGESSATNGFSVDSFSVEAIPEPAVLGFIALAGIGSLVARRFFE